MKHLIFAFFILPVTLAAQLSITTATINPTCAGNSNGTVFSTTTGGVSPYSWLWSNGKTTRNVNLLPAGNYTVTVTDSNGDTAETTATLTEPPEIVAGFSYVSNGNGTFTATVTATGGVGGYNYTRTGLSNWQSDGVFVVPAGTYIFKCRDSNNCQKSIIKKIQ